MLIHTIKELGGCLRDTMPCKFLVGSFYPKDKDYVVYCSLGNECCRGYCCYHLDDDREYQIKEIREISN